MIIKIVCAGKNNFKELYQPDEKELLVGVDGGIYDIVKMDKKVDLAVGDFDSCNIEEVVMHCDKIRVFPREKDYSDLELAIMEIQDYQFEKIIIYNATGGRLDHFQATLNVLIKYANLNIEIIDNRNLIKVINQSTGVSKSQYKYCSLFAIDEGVRISLKGFRYSLENYALHKFDNLCLSNEIIDEGFIEVNNKRILMIESN